MTLRKLFLVFIVYLLARCISGWTTLPLPLTAHHQFSLLRKGHFRSPANTASPILWSTSSSSSEMHPSSAVSKVVSISPQTSENTPEGYRPPFPIVLWRFTRPHTLIGSALAIPAIHFLAAPSLSAAFATANFVSMIYAMIPALLMNLYITGLNQVSDVEIDKINKPNLPIAAGILSVRDGVLTCLTALALSLYMGVAHPLYGTPGLNVALWGSGILGTMYSLPPFRLKRFPLLAAFCIVAVRGTIINAGFFAHAKAAAFGMPGASVLGCLLTDPQCLLSSTFFGIFGIVIALMKDVPDVLGDLNSNVRTFSVRLGQTRVFHATRRLLCGLFLATGAGFFYLASLALSSHLLFMARILTGIFAIWAGLSVRTQARPVSPENPQQVYSFYMYLWKLFYLSYLVLPFAR